MKRRGLLLILSVIVAAVGTGLIALYVKGADDRAASDQEMVTVLVASQAIGASTSAAEIANTSLTTTDLPRKSVPESAFFGPNAAEDFQTKLNGRMTITRIPKGQTIVPEAFSSPGAAASSSGVPADKMGLVLAIANPERAIGLITPGNPVTIFGNRSGKTWIMVSRAMVMAVDSETAAEGNGGSAAGDARATGTVSLALDVNDAGKLIFATKSGIQIYMAVPGTKVPDTAIPVNKTFLVKDVMP